MEKQFRLPKEFTEKWLEALRSGEYKQGFGALQSFTYDTDEKTPTYCCLGVAGVICEIPEELLRSNGFLYTAKMESFLIPDEIKGEPLNNKLVATLANLNDGLSLYWYNSGSNKDKFSSFNFRNGNSPEAFFENTSRDFKMNFLEIADFIEDNCELY